MLHISRFSPYCGQLDLDVVSGKATENHCKKKKKGLGHKTINDTWCNNNTQTDCDNQVIIG